MRPIRLSPSWGAALLAGLVLLHGCGAALESIAIESRPLTRIHVPTKVEVGHTFTVAVDVDTACGEFQRLAIDENGMTGVITVDAMFLPPPKGVACIQAIILKRFEGTTRATSVGPYAVSFKGYGGRATKTIEVLPAPVPAWQPPAFDAGNVETNY